MLSSVFTIGCKSYTKAYTKTKSYSITPQAPLAKEFKVALYKSQIDYKDKHFSGLFYFKKNADSTTRIIFMSEIGLSLFDFEFKNHNFEIKSCQEFFSNKLLIKTIQDDLRLLLDMPNDGKITEFQEATNQLKIVRVQGKLGNLHYFYNPKNELYQLIKKQTLFSTIIGLSEYENDVPKSIVINHKGIGLQFAFQLLNLK